MKVLCVNKIYPENKITIGKWYELNWGSYTVTSNDYDKYPQDEYSYFIINDDGSCQWERKEQFLNLKEFRDKRLKEIFNGL